MVGLGALSDQYQQDIPVGVSKNRGVSPKMDGEKNGIFPIQMDDLGGFSPTIFWKHPSE